MSSLGYNGLIPLVLCVLHLIHNGSYYGFVVAYGNEVKNLAIDLHGWFKIAPCKREDFQMVGEEFGQFSSIFNQHLNTRWLTLVLFF